jgi:hypothetical protein
MFFVSVDTLPLFVRRALYRMSAVLPLRADSLARFV